MWIVKLGGSLFDSAHLCDWLRALTRQGPLVIVPGGGPFADQVRLAQQQWKFDDSSAHIMALLAMEQYGRMLCALQPGLVAAAHPEEIDAVLAEGGRPVWMPTAMVLAAPEIQHSWDVTSDSLAAWLGGRLGAEKLLLVKSKRLEGDALPVSNLMESHFVDARFGEILRPLPLEAWTMAQGDHARFGEFYRGRTQAATRILE
ncbi:MAG: amino acid kinase [Candidatus Thiodiazotropha sp.]